MLKKASAFLSLFFLFAGTSYGLSVPEKPSGYIHDTAGLLSEPAKFALTHTLSQFEQSTSNQVVVAVFTSLEGGSLEDFSIKLAEKWKVGQKGRDNGVILLVFKEDQAVRIEVGYGLEGALPDAVASQIIYNEIVPRFREGNFEAGVTNGVSAIIQATRGEYKALAKEDPIEKYSPWLYLVLILYFLVPLVCYALVMFLSILAFGFPIGAVMGTVFVMILFIFRMIFSKGLVAGHTYSGRRGGGFSGGSGGSWGSGGFGGGGFSGGGGSFGGGGASGRW